MLNVNAFVFKGAEYFSIGMVLRDHHDTFLERKILCLSGPASVFEAEAIGFRKALSWLMTRHTSGVIIESDILF